MEKENKKDALQSKEVVFKSTHLKGSFFCRIQQWLVTMDDKWLSGDLVLVLVHYLQLWFQ